jgi:hypothetical protein
MTALNHTSLEHWRDNPIAFTDMRSDDGGRLLYSELLPHRGVQSDAARSLNRS